MSDKELVTVDREQFEALTSVLNHLERTLFNGLKAIVAASGSGGGNSEVLTAINNLDRKVDIMSSNLDRIEKEAADAAGNVELVRAAMEELKTISAGMQAEIAALRQQVEQGQIDQARLEAAAATFEKADDDIDALVLPGTPEPTPEPAPEEPGTSGRR